MIDANGRKTVLVVETDLQLGPPEIDFDKVAVDARCRDLDESTHQILSSKQCGSLEGNPDHPSC